MDINYLDQSILTPSACLHGQKVNFGNCKKKNNSKCESVVLESCASGANLSHGVRRVSTPRPSLCACARQGRDSEVPDARMDPGGPIGPGLNRQICPPLSCLNFQGQLKRR